MLSTSSSRLRRTPSFDVNRGWSSEMKDGHARTDNETTRQLRVPTTTKSIPCLQFYVPAPSLSRYLSHIDIVRELSVKSTAETSATQEDGLKSPAQTAAAEPAPSLHAPAANWPADGRGVTRARTPRIVSIASVSGSSGRAARRACRCHGAPSTPSQPPARLPTETTKLWQLLLYASSPSLLLVTRL